MGLPHVTQAADAIRAFMARLESLTWTTSSEKVFKNASKHSSATPDNLTSQVWFSTGRGDPTGIDYPCALVSFAGSQPDDDNQTSRHHTVRLEVEVRQRSLTRSDYADAFGANRQNTDGSIGAGLIDIWQKIVSDIGNQTTSDNAELQSQFRYVGVGGMTSTGQGAGVYASVTLEYEANLLINNQ